MLEPTYLYSGWHIKLIVASFILMAGFVVGRVVGKFVEKGLHELYLNEFFRKAVKRKLAVEKTAGTLVSFAIYLYTIFMVLKSLGVTQKMVYIAAVVIALGILVSFLVGLLDFFPRWYAGLLLRGGLDVGEYVRVGTLEGTIMRKGLLECELESASGDKLLVPYDRMRKEKLVRPRKAQSQGD